MGLFDKKSEEPLPPDCIRAFRFKTCTYLFFQDRFEFNGVVMPYNAVTYIEAPNHSVNPNGKYFFVAKNGAGYGIEQCEELLFFLYSRCPDARIG